MVVNSLTERRGKDSARGIDLHMWENTACHLFLRLTRRVTSAIKVAAKFLLLYF